MEPGVQTCEETLGLREGSCRDSAWLLVQILRHLGLAARFVSGYLVQLTADVEALDGPSGPAADFTDLHAWAEVYVPGAGWIGLDATSGLLAGEGHIPLACTPDPAGAAAVTGYTGRSEVTLEFSNEVQRIHEDPRVTLPYSEAQWQRAMALGRRIEQDLESGDVRLTMGGEPTFVSIDDMDGVQWNTAALGDDKLRLAHALLQRLRLRYAEGGIVHYGQGKWYPGEPLPRWALSCFWRTDGVPLWRDPRLLADPDAPATAEPSTALRWMEALAGATGVSLDHVQAGYEDAYYYLWREGTLPENVDALDSHLDDPMERARLRNVFEAGLDRIVGYALPIRRNPDARPGSGWESCAWPLRRGRLFLVAGDSPMGLRLPLSSLPWVAEDEREPAFERDPFAPLLPLAAPDPAAPPREIPHASEPSAGEPGGAPRDSTSGRSTRRAVFHTALCVEPRDGRLYVFLPPLTHLEDFVALLSAIETACRETGIAVVLEGYPAPEDPRLKSLQITPDPGVIEVNVHPASNWDELVALTTSLYEDARQVRLGAEKFMLDGRHTGTGGGNHVTLGGQTPVDSPLLRRPSLLRSLVLYWQHHPALSYLFSGTFIGPTSQAPRIDEARHESLYELEIALQQLPAGDSPQPWLVDRLLRNLLVDITGNTHRAEFCIDKLYSPDSAGGRRGLLELRAFEMPPHARMSLVQMLLLRALVARFWRAPYNGRPIRWGTALHDRFMLPHFIWDDMRDVVSDLRENGYPFEPDWFAPFMEFRYPRFGSINVQGVQLELRSATEPWHVLGEETAAGGTARYVDSSVERLQVMVRGMNPVRHAVLCNGRRVPLHPTGTPGEAVAGVRFKAWQPASGLHPAIGVHAPLVFDLLDVGNGRSLGGCTYHVAHPGGRNYETFPVNASEAEARRTARFWPHGHTPGRLDPPREDRNPEYPMTLDLRYRPAAWW